jgi:hypothetical protein
MMDNDEDADDDDNDDLDDDGDDYCVHKQAVVENIFQSSQL